MAALYVPYPAVADQHEEGRALSKDFVAMWVASVASYIGTLIQSAGASWLSTSLVSSADTIALVQIENVLPVVLFSLPASAAADAWDRRSWCSSRRPS